MTASKSEPMGARGWEPNFNEWQLREGVINEILTGTSRPSYYKQHEPAFPTIGVCAVCHGVTGCCDRGGITMSKQEAFMLALVEHGVYLEKWKGQNVGNSFDFPYLCNCACQHEWTEISRPPTPYSGLHRRKCIKCGHEIEVDTSD